MIMSWFNIVQLKFSVKTWHNDLALALENLSLVSDDFIKEQVVQEVNISMTCTL